MSKNVFNFTEGNFNTPNSGDMLTNRFHTYTTSDLMRLAKDLHETNQGYPIVQKVIAVIEMRLTGEEFQAWKREIGI